MQHFGLVLLLAGVVGVMTATNTDPVAFWLAVGVLIAAVFFWPGGQAESE